MTSYGSGPWYEETGPNAKYVREDIFKKLNRQYFESICWNEDIIKRILLKHIPNSKKDFGSYRGYATFGLTNECWKQIITDIDQIENSIKTLQKKFLPYVNHWLYKSDGLRMKNLTITTMVGKT